jgi:PAS domain S-box-containing protein
VVPGELKAHRLGFAGLPDPVDGAVLRALGEALWERRGAIAAEWTRRLVAAAPHPVPHELSGEVLGRLNEAFLTVFLQQVRDGDLTKLYQGYYEVNHRLIDADLRRGPGSRMSLEGLYTSARISAEVIELQLDPHELRLAWSRLATRLAMIVGLAYSDCREEHLQESFREMQTLSALFQGVLESAPDAMIIAERDDTIVLLNSSAERMFGYSRAELTGQRLSWLTCPPEPDRDAATRDADERVGRHRDGRELPIEVRSSHLETQAGTLVVHAVRDITERHRAEAALLRARDELELRVARRTEELVRVNEALHGEIARRQSIEDSLRREKSFADTILDSLPGIFYLFDSEGRFLRWNRNFAAVSGYDATEIARMHPIDLFDPEEKDYIADSIAAVFATGATTAEAVLVSKDGTRTPHFFTGLKVSVEGVPCVIGMGIDISERKRMEEALHASSAELARSNQIKTYFAATISHELRNTFNGIMISIEVILGDASFDLHPRHRDLLRSIQHRVREAIQIIHATLELTRSEMQPGADGSRLVDIVDVVGELVGEVTAQPSRSEVPLCWNVPPHLPPFRTDPVKLKMILKNLVENAVKFTPEGRIDVSVRIEDGLLCCTVADTGVGIAPSERSRIFEPFQRGDGHDHRRVAGTGLGLYIVRRLVDLLGGTIDVQSVPDRGTTFVLRIPSLPLRERA